MENFDSNKIIADLLQKNLGKVLSGVHKFGTEKYKEILAKTTLAFKNYLDSSLKRHSKVKTILYREVPVNLEDFYVHSDVKYRTNEISIKNIDDLLKISNSIIITGTAGAGKSTFMKYLFVNTVKGQNYIPLHIELRNLNNSNISLKDYIYNSLTIGGFNLEREYFFTSLESGKFIIFLDGYDEIDNNRKDEITKELIDIKDQYSKNSFIVFSRPDSTFVSWSNFTEIKLQPLSKDKAIELINKLDYDSEIKEKFLSELDQRLYNQHKSFVSNPLLLTIMIMTFNQFAEIPDKMHLFYEQAFDTLYSKHDATKTGYKRVMDSNLAKDEFQKVLSCFSLLSYSKGDYNFDSSKIESYLEQTKKLVGIEFKSESYLNDLIKSVCLLLQDGFIYTFSHRTFQEYFASKYLVTLKDETLLRMLPKITQTSNTDKVLDILFELDKDRVEELLIIPVLTELKEQLNYNEVDKFLCYRDLIQIIFKEFTVHATPITFPYIDGEAEEDDEEFAVSLTVRSDKNDPLYETALKYERILDFVDAKYDDVEISIRKTQLLTEQEISDKYYIDPINLDEDIPSQTYYEMSTLNNEQIFRDIFCETNPRAKSLFKAMVLLDVIIEKHENKQNDIAGILFN